MVVPSAEDSSQETARVFIKKLASSTSDEASKIGAEIRSVIEEDGSQAESSSQNKFPPLLSNIVRGLTKIHIQSELPSGAWTWLQHTDTAILGMKTVIQILSHPNKMTSQQLFETAKKFLTPMSPKLKPCLLLTGSYSPKLQKTCSPKGYEEIYSQMWLAISKLKLDSRTHRRLLQWLPEKVMPRMSDAVLLTDFFIASFQLGEPYNVLSLNGIFCLMQYHNLEYPDFYSQVYNLIQPAVCGTGHEQKFFELVDLFLSSTHLPAYLVAAFVKRLSRLTLFIPAESCQMLVQLIENLLIRHSKAVSCLVRRDSQETIEQDPFNDDDPNPSTCNALESSLWELKTMQSHWYWKVGKVSKFVDSNLPSVEIEIDVPDEQQNWKEEVSLKNRKEAVPQTFMEPPDMFDDSFCPGISF